MRSSRSIMRSCCVSILASRSITSTRKSSNFSSKNASDMSINPFASEVVTRAAAARSEHSQRGQAQPGDGPEQGISIAGNARARSQKFPYVAQPGSEQTRIHAVERGDALQARHHVVLLLLGELDLILLRGRGALLCLGAPQVVEHGAVAGGIVRLGQAVRGALAQGIECGVDGALALPGDVGLLLRRVALVEELLVLREQDAAQVLGFAQELLVDLVLERGLLVNVGARGAGGTSHEGPPFFLKGNFPAPARMRAARRVATVSALLTVGLGLRGHRPTVRRTLTVATR